MFLHFLGKMVFQEQYLLGKQQNALTKKKEQYHSLFSRMNQNSTLNGFLHNIAHVAQQMNATRLFVADEIERHFDGGLIDKWAMQVVEHHAHTCLSFGHINILRIGSREVCLSSLCRKKVRAAKAIAAEM
jgi:fructose-1,6-bisphosphatase